MIAPDGRVGKGLAGYLFAKQMRGCDMFAQGTWW
jgi:hypothetical protein